ncbi:hypothetical protein [Clostridium sp. ZS2-4]|uniref:hypothetical protein n=1 Tax=Clostridium sp. ZS2-4 TaxID=2987703 RepID=UPI00227C82EB|nr:hypothetical protein [Clostridium sp. ZS2-4]MCY6356417.1 hypothetical protein [Clostridium sp. ZS2-4]
MKTIAFVGENNDKVFKSNLLDLVGDLGLEYKDISRDVLYDEKYSDYIIINSYVDTKSIRLNCGYCLANMDNLFKNHISIHGNLITYGFGAKNTVTISSVENEEFVYCLQRCINISNSQGIEPQEIPVAIEFQQQKELYLYMTAITICLIENVNIKKVIEKKSRKYLSTTNNF